MGALRRLSAKRVGLLASGIAVAAVIGASSVAVLLSGGDAPPENADCARSTALTVNEAASLAASCDDDVEIVSERTPWARSWATAAGETRLEVSAVPWGVERDGEWVPLDTSWVSDAESGAISVAAGVYEMDLNGGDTSKERRPLGVIERGDQRLEIWFPLELPEPELDGATASYDLDEGVRLDVTVQPDGAGFSPVVVLDSPEAARRFEQALSEAGGTADAGPFGIRYTMQPSEGLRVIEADGGAVNVVDADSTVHFSSPPSLMWDSSGARIAPMKVEVDPAGVTVRPDEAILSDEATEWPVYLDPGFNGAIRNEWILVRTGGFTSSIHNWTAEIDGGNGRCTDSTCNTDFTARLAWEFGGLDTIKNMAGADVVSAQFGVNGIHSYNCTAATTDLYLTNEISTATTWGNLGQGDVLSSITGSQRPSCATSGWKEFDATVGVRRLADNNWASLSIGLKSQNESTMAGWKRFAYNATLSVTYNRAPNTPSSLQLTDPNVPGCVTGATRPVIADATPTMSAIVTDPDGGSVNARFYAVAVSAPSTVLWNAAAVPGSGASGTRFTSMVSSGVFQNGGTYAWRVQAGDGARLSPFTAWCEFTVDTKSPGMPTVTPTAAGAQALYEENAERGGVGLLGRFTVNRGADSDVVTFKYGFNDPAMTKSISPAADGTAVLSHAPIGAGRVTLSVQSFDRAGNFSPVRSYVFDVAAPTEDGIWQLDEGAGTTAADSAGLPHTRPLGVTGATWADGPHREFQSRASDRALSFDGVDDAAASGASVVDTKKSFTVSALVRLDPAFDPARAATAVSQDGSSGSGFTLGYRTTCQTTGAGCWAFNLPATDGGAAMSVQSDVGVEAGSWVLLVGEHDTSKQQMRLWVCSVGTPEQPSAGDPVVAAANRAATTWSATGSFALGRARAGGVPAEWWNGEVDSARVFSGQVVDESKVRRLCQGAEAGAFDGSDGWTGGDAALDPTVSEQ